MRPPHERPSVLGEVPKSIEGTGTKCFMCPPAKKRSDNGVEARGGGETMSLFFARRKISTDVFFFFSYPGMYMWCGQTLLHSAVEIGLAMLD